MCEEREAGESDSNHSLFFSPALWKEVCIAVWRGINGGTSEINGGGTVGL